MTEALLENRDYTVIFAKTAEPAVPPPGYAKRWTDAETAIIRLLQACEAFDPDGITLSVACEATEGGCEFKWFEHVRSNQLTHIIHSYVPPYAVSLAAALQASLNTYFERKQQGHAKPNGEIILVILDGEPLDRMAIANVIVKATHQMNADEELGIGLVQIGDDPIARGFFQSLDDDLKGAGAQFDIVETQILETIEPEALIQFLMNTIQD
jgi:hypothetical protein